MLSGLSIGHVSTVDPNPHDSGVLSSVFSMLHAGS